METSENALIRNYFGIEKTARNMNKLKQNHPEYENLISFKNKRPKKIANPKIAKDELIKSTISKAKFINNWKGARLVINHYRKYQSKLYYTPKELVDEFQEKITLEKPEIEVAKDEDDMLVQINDVFNMLKLKWNEKTQMKASDVIYNSNLVLTFEGGVDFFSISHELVGMTVDIRHLTNQIYEFDTKYNDERSENGVFVLRSATLRVYSGPVKDGKLRAYGKPKKTSKSLFSPVLYNWNCCLSEIACFLRCRDSNIINRGWYKFQNKREWAQINVEAITRNVFSKELTHCFLSADIKAFVIEWNKCARKMDIILYNSVTQEYFPYEHEGALILFWYPYHVEVFDKINLPDKKQFRMKQQLMTTNEYVICAIDFETYRIDKEGTQKPYLICIYSDKFQHVLTTLDELMIYFEVLSKHKVKYVFWAHNGMKFDYVFMLPYLVKYFNIRINGKIGELKSIEFKNIKLLDFYKFFNASLNTLAKTFLGQSKFEFDFTKVYDELSVKEHMSEATTYCMQDCKLLYDLVLKFDLQCKNEFKTSINDCFSASHLAKQVFQQFYLTTNLSGSLDEDYAIEKSSYHGGMCMNYVKGYCKEKIYAYDINSSYPYSMLKKMPFIFLKQTSYMNTKLIQHDLYYVMFEFPEYSRLCNLAMKVEDELVFLKKGEGWYWGCELIISQKLNATLVILKHRHYKAKKLFSEYIMDIYEKRKQAKADKNMILVELYKKLLNSLYGKFGQKLHHKNYIEKYDMFIGNNMKLNNLKMLTNECIYVEYHDKYEYFNNIGSLVRFSSYISAQSRCTLLDPITNINQQHLLYMDTDSLFLTCKINNKYLNEIELGKFKCEEYNEGIFICAKNYMLSDGIKEICKMKGVNKAEKKNYMELLANGITTIKTTQSKKEFGKVQICDILKTVTSHSFKRYNDAYYTFPHSDIIQFAEYKRQQQILKIKTKVGKREEKDVTAKLILNHISSGVNMPLILPHKDIYSKDVQTYLKYRIVPYNPKCLSQEEKCFIFDEIYGKNDIDVRMLLLKLYNVEEHSIPVWKAHDVGYFKKVLLKLQYKYKNNL